MAVFEVLAEMVGTEELLRLVALAELVGLVKVIDAIFPVGRVDELLATVSATIGCSGVEAPELLRRGVVVVALSWDMGSEGVHRGRVEGGLEGVESGAGPGVTT